MNGWDLGVNNFDAHQTWLTTSRNTLLSWVNCHSTKLPNLSTFLQTKTSLWYTANFRFHCITSRPELVIPCGIQVRNRQPRGLVKDFTRGKAKKKRIFILWIILPRNDYGLVETGMKNGDIRVNRTTMVWSYWILSFEINTMSMVKRSRFTLIEVTLERRSKCSRTNSLSAHHFNTHFPPLGPPFSKCKLLEAQSLSSRLILSWRCCDPRVTFRKARLSSRKTNGSALGK